MDSPQLALLKVDLASQKTTIERVFGVLQSRAQNLDPDNIEKLESVAYQIHNFYGSVEEFLKIVATHFENNISDSSKWHSLLLKRMTQPIEGIRPALLSLESYELLNGLRAFRHFFRHAYGVSLDFYQLKANLERAVKFKPLLDKEIKFFYISYLEPCPETLRQFSCFLQEYGGYHTVFKIITNPLIFKVLQ